MRDTRFFISWLGIFIFWSTSWAQQLLPERQADWSSAGVSKDLIYPSVELNMLDYGGIRDGSASNHTAFEALLMALNDQPGIVYFPTGIYHFSEPIFISDNIILRGAGSDSTILEFDLGGSDHCINIIGARSHDSIAVIQPISKDDLVITLEEIVGLAAGDYFILLFDDQSLVNDSWAEKSVGQINRITSLQQGHIEVEHPIRREYSLSSNPYIEPINPVHHVGLSCLKIKRLDATASHTSNIHFALAAECWLSSIESEQANFSHVVFERSIHCSVEGSYFHHAFNYGSGGNAYGITLQYTTGDVLIQNSIFEHLRHSILLQAGANGNVLADNYSTDPYKIIDIGGQQIPTNVTGDLVCHGNYPYANLFEGNIASFGIVDASHGANGPFNTYFRNRMDLYGLQISNSSPDNNSQNIIGNEVNSMTINEIDHYSYGNNVQGTVVPPGTNEMTVMSFFHGVAPAYFNGLPWPSIGYPANYGAGTNPAKIRFQSGQYTDNCVELNDCPDTQQIDRIGYQEPDYQAKINIKATAIVYPFQQINLQAGTEVLLQSGFELRNGASMSISIAGCP
ncbi:MAG: glycoside hydrolase family 55 protein [Saprospiraceae bacterium]|nr:glycoside hydrolase family 55 protein [Saprospiraceae bacterium]